MESSLSELGPEELAGLESLLREKALDLFNVCDKEQKGFVTKRDMQRMRTQLPLEPDQLEDVFDTLDDDKNGYLTLDEFTEGFAEFLGIQVNHENKVEKDEEEMQDTVEDMDQAVLEQPRLTSLPLASEAAAELDELLSSLGLSPLVSEESGALASMWTRLRSEKDPAMVADFEAFLAKLAADLRRRDTEHQAMASNMKERKALQEEHLHKLSEEMERQVTAEKERLRQEEERRELRLRTEMAEALEAKEQQIMDSAQRMAFLEEQLEQARKIVPDITDENQHLARERDQLLHEVDRQRILMKTLQEQMERTRLKSQNESRERAKAAFKVSEHIAQEREELVQELKLVKRLNNRIRDQKDADQNQREFGDKDDLVTSLADELNNQNSTTINRMSEDKRENSEKVGENTNYIDDELNREANDDLDKTKIQYGAEKEDLDKSKLCVDNTDELVMTSDYECDDDVYTSSNVAVANLAKVNRGASLQDELEEVHAVENNINQSLFHKSEDKLINTNNDNYAVHEEALGNDMDTSLKDEQKTILEMKSTSKNSEKSFETSNEDIKSANKTLDNTHKRKDDINTKVVMEAQSKENPDNNQNYGETNKLHSKNAPDSTNIHDASITSNNALESSSSSQTIESEGKPSQKSPKIDSNSVLEMINEVLDPISESSTSAAIIEATSTDVSSSWTSLARSETVEPSITNSMQYTSLPNKSVTKRKSRRSKTSKDMKRPNNSIFSSSLVIYHPENQSKRAEKEQRKASITAMETDNTSLTSCPGPISPLPSIYDTDDVSTLQNTRNIDVQRVFKLIFVGDSSVGKTAIISRFCSGQFDHALRATVGVDFRTRAVNVGGQNVCLQCWDTAGQERYRAMTTQYFRKTDGVVVVYDLSSERSFVNARQWMNTAMEVVGEDAAILLLGNKLDLVEDDLLRKVRKSSGQALSTQFSALFGEVSALSGRHVEARLIDLARILREKEDQSMQRALTLTDQEPKKKCCRS